MNCCHEPLICITPRVSCLTFGGSDGQGAYLRSGVDVIFYQPVQSERFFSAGVKYDAINWNDFKQVVAAFKTRIEDWYIRPAGELRKASWDYSFALMAINCLLIDALSQFHYGKVTGTRGIFKKYVRKKLPAFRATLPQKIQERPTRRKHRKSAATKPKLKPQKPEYFEDFADVLYHCFRCGILHEAHIAGCGGLAGLNGKMVDVDPDVCTRYRDGSDCPTVRMDPTAIFDEVRKLFDQYLNDLVDPNPKLDPRRRKFKRKFTDCIGVNIKNSV